MCSCVMGTYRGLVTVALSAIVCALLLDGPTFVKAEDQATVADRASDRLFDTAVQSGGPFAVEEVPVSPAGAPVLAPAPVQPLNTDVIRLPATDPALSNDSGLRKLLQGPRAVAPAPSVARAPAAEVPAAGRAAEAAPTRPLPQQLVWPSFQQVPAHVEAELAPAPAPALATHSRRGLKMIPTKSAKMHAHAPAPVVAAHLPAHAPLPSTMLLAGRHKAAAAKRHALLRAPEREEEDRPAHKAQGRHLAPEAAPAGRAAPPARAAQHKPPSAGRVAPGPKAAAKAPTPAKHQIPPARVLPAPEAAKEQRRRLHQSFAEDLARHNAELVKFLSERPVAEQLAKPALAPKATAPVKRRLQQMTADDPTEAVDVTSLLAALEPSDAAESSTAPTPSPASGLRRRLRQTADDPTEAADITSLLALIEEPSEEAHTSTAPAPGATLRRRLKQTTADDPTESADLTSLLTLIEEPSEEVEVSVAPGPGTGRHLLQQMLIDEKSNGPFFNGEGKQIGHPATANIMALLAAPLAADVSIASEPSAEAEAPGLASQHP
ncbi:g5537 [Coccomyxa elongata]